MRMYFNVLNTTIKHCRVIGDEDESGKLTERITETQKQGNWR